MRFGISGNLIIVFKNILPRFARMLTYTINIPLVKCMAPDGLRSTLIRSKFLNFVEEHASQTPHKAVRIATYILHTQQPPPCAPPASPPSSTSESAKHKCHWNTCEAGFASKRQENTFSKICQINKVLFFIAPFSHCSCIRIFLAQPLLFSLLQAITSRCHVVSASSLVNIQILYKKIAKIEVWGKKKNFRVHVIAVDKILSVCVSSTVYLVSLWQILFSSSSVNILNQKHESMVGLHEISCPSVWESCFDDCSLRRECVSFGESWTCRGRSFTLSDSLHCFTIFLMVTSSSLISLSYSDFKTSDTFERSGKPTVIMFSIPSTISRLRESFLKLSAISRRFSLVIPSQCVITRAVNLFALREKLLTARMSEKWLSSV